MTKMLVDLGAASCDVGVKAARLGEIAKLGFAVPRTRILPFRVLEPFDAKRLPVLSDGVRQELVDALSELGGGPIAVRSSASHEDSPFVSCAGLYETLLGVRTSEQLFCAIDACVRSLWSHVAMTYAEICGLSADSNRMSIMLQEQVSPDRAGVLFTLKPDCGATDQMYVEWCDGMATSIVAGAADPNCALIDRGTAPAASLFQRLHALGLALERHFGRPQDVEWGLCGDTLYVFQSRDIVPTVAPRATTVSPLSCRGVFCGMGVGTLTRARSARASGIEILLFDDPPANDYDLARVRSAAGVVLTTGGKLSHFASIVRELGVPTIVKHSSSVFHLIGTSVAIDAHRERLVPTSGLPGAELKEALFQSVSSLAQRLPYATRVEKYEGVSLDPLVAENLRRNLSATEARVRDEVETLYPFDERCRNSYGQVSARIQQTARHCRVQFKRWQRLSEVDLRLDDEVHLAVADVNEGQVLLLSLGLIEFESQQRATTSYEVGECVFNFYRWPASPRTYVSIEAPSVDAAADALGKQGYPLSVLSALDGKRIFDRLGITLADPLKFEHSENSRFVSERGTESALLQG